MKHFQIIILGEDGQNPKTYRIGFLKLLLIRMTIIFLLLSTLILLTAWSFIAQRLLQYGEVEHERDSLSVYAVQLDSLKSNILEIDQYLAYFRLVSGIDAKNTPPPLDEFLSDTVLAYAYEVSDARKDFRRVPRLKPVTGVMSRGFDPKIGHEAIDFAAAFGSPIRVTADGVVKKFFNDEYLGLVVVISHDSGYETLYAHCKETLVKENQKVIQGETIALVGNSGKSSSGSHLHYEVRRDGKLIDPTRLFL